MKQIQFEHYRKAPHPFQQYGNLPPTSLKNRSLQQQYGALPQGEEAFVNKIGKKVFYQRYNSSIKQHWLGIQNNDSLFDQVARHNHKVKGKSLETKDIEGAQGGSLKSTAVRNKQKAYQIKNKNKSNIFYDPFENEKQQYRDSIQKAIRYQHSNDREIGKMISQKGHGHYLNPQNHHSRISNNNSLRKRQNDNQQYLKQKYQGFEVRDEKYKQFFSNATKDEDTYDKFFSRLSSKSNQEQQADSGKSSRTPIIRQKNYSRLEKYNTIGHSENQHKTTNDEQMQKQYERWRKQQLLKNYQPPNFSKKSIQSQFRNQQSLNSQNNSNISHSYRQLNESIGISPIVRVDIKKQEQQQMNKLNGEKINMKPSRKANPTNLSNPFDSK